MSRLSVGCIKKVLKGMDQTTPSGL